MHACVRDRPPASLLLQRQIVAILVLHILADPQHHTAQSHQRIGDDILDTHTHHRPLNVLDNKFQDKDGDTAGHAARERRKSQKEDHARLPRDARPAVAERVGRQALLLDAVDDEHAQRREDEGQPVDERDVYVGAVEWGLGPDGCIEEDVKGEGELANRRKTGLAHAIRLFFGGGGLLSEGFSYNRALVEV